MRLYLNVPYGEKGEAKTLGAKWDPRVKKWYTDSDPDHYVRFAKWILRESDDVLIATEYLHIIEGVRPCWKCGRPTRVVGLGFGEFIHIFGEPDDPQYEFIEDYLDPGQEVHLAWAQEEEIPPRLLRYLKEHYSVRTGYSKTVGESCFANHCDSCGAMQGNWFLFGEPDSPLSSEAEGNELVERMRGLKIYAIPIEDNLQLNWDVGFCSNDYAYLKYGRYEELILSTDPDNEYITYEELYREEGRGGR